MDFLRYFLCGKAIAMKISKLLSSSGVVNG